MSEEQRTYLFGDTALAAERLRLLAEVFALSSREFLESLAAYDPRRIADLGCGPGYTSMLLAEVFPAAAVLGFDSSASYVEQARRLGSDRVRFSLADVTQSLPSGPFDLIYARYLLTHLADWRAALGVWSEGLAPRGLVVIEENEWIHTSRRPFAEYLAIVECMLGDRGCSLYVGGDLAARKQVAGLEIARSEELPIAVADRIAARMFLPNLQTWRFEPFVRQRFSTRHLEQLEFHLQHLAAAEESTSSITFGRRRVVLARTAAGP